MGNSQKKEADDETGEPIYLNVYEQPEGSNILFGIYHTGIARSESEVTSFVSGVEVYGTEYSFAE